MATELRQKCRKLWFVCTITTFFAIILSPSIIAGNISISLGRTASMALPVKTSTVFIAKKSIITAQVKGNKQVFLTAKKLGKTDLYFLDDKNNTVSHEVISVVVDQDNLRAAIKVVAPDANIRLVSLGNSLILKGQIYSIKEADAVDQIVKYLASTGSKILNLVTLERSDQVYLQVKVVEMTKQVINKLGLNRWELLLKTAGSNFLFGSNPTESQLGGISGNKNLNGLIDMLGEDGMLSIISEPNLVAEPGKKASFLAGGEFPIIVPNGGSNAIANNTIEYKKFGVSLSFLPTLLDNRVINLNVTTEVSSLSNEASVRLNSISVPSLTTRKASTTVQVRSGQSFAIAGLVQKTELHSKRRVPLLGDIPLVGRLFRSTDQEKNEKELVIIVTPYLVNPTSARLMTPVDGTTLSAINKDKYRRIVNKKYIVE